MRLGNRLLTLARTFVRLGLGNVAAVFAYRIAARRGWLNLRSANLPPGPLLREQVSNMLGACPENLVAEAGEILAGQFRMFGRPALARGSPPDWLGNPLSGTRASNKEPWWKLADFDPQLGDIKGFWELSRFDWMLVLARYARHTADCSAIRQINDWTADWLANNPSYRGLNWKCGQETSIRLMQVLLSVRLLGQDRTPEPLLASFVGMHLARIARTHFYAVAQDNNHATSEAFALFAGGGWLAQVAKGQLRQRALSWSRMGRASLERSIKKLIFADGGFSQYSVNYHRVLIDTLSHAESWRRHLRLPEFTSTFYSRAAAATGWLAALVNAHSGDAPNLGANDGAMVYRLDDLLFRDYRPSVQLAATLFCGRAAYGRGPWDRPLTLLRIASQPVDPSLSAKQSRVFSDFGLVLLNPRRNGSGAYAFVRVPSARFRPSQADPLHLDLWTEKGVNLLRDAGTYSYADDSAVQYFSGIAAHCTIAFDDRDPMPRLSRFLFGDWIAGEMAPIDLGVDGSLMWHGSYVDAFGAEHRRTVHADGDRWTVDDDIGGYSRRAVLRWRLPPGLTEIRQNCVTTEQMTIEIEADAKPLSITVGQAWESRFYAWKELMPEVTAVFDSQTRRICSRITLR